MTLARRIIESSLWATAANAAAVCVILVRSIMLARLLPVEVFGVYAFAATVVGLTAVAARFGLDGALLHRSDETRDESRAAAVHFTLTASFSILWAAGLIAGASVFSEGDFLLALLVLTGSQIGTHLASTPRTLLQRRVTHQPLAWLRISGAVISTGIALGLARAGHGLWALLMIDATAAALSLIVLYLWRPVWRPRLLWDARAVRYFLSFGARNLLGRLLEEGFSRDCEELCLIHGTVVVQDGSPSRFDVVKKHLVVLRHHGEPGFILLQEAAWGRSLYVTIHHVELVCELVENDVPSTVGGHASVLDRIPRKNDRTALPRLPSRSSGCLNDHAVGTVGYYERARIDQDGWSSVVVVVLDVQKKAYSLGGDGHTDGVIEFKSSTTLPVFLGDKNAQVPSKDRLFVTVVCLVEGEAR